MKTQKINNFLTVENNPGNTPDCQTHQKMRDITKIIIHCTANRADSKITATDIDRYHRSRGFDSIGYHYVILQDGTIQQGRPIEKIGAHCRGHNRDSIGIAYVGGIDSNNKPADTRTPQQRQALRNLLSSLRHEYPEAVIYGHNELTCKRAQSRTLLDRAECNGQCTNCKFAAKACPCFNVKDEFRQ